MFDQENKLYWNGKEWFPKRIDFQDGSAIIEYENGSIIIIESQQEYNGSSIQQYFWCNFSPFSLN